MPLHASVPQSASLDLVPSSGLLAPHPAFTLNAEVTLTSLPGVHCCSVAQEHPILCDPMDCSMPGFPVLHHLSEF